MKMRLLAVAVVVLAASGVFAQEAATGSLGNLEAGFPTAIIDTTPTAVGAWELGVNMGYMTNGAVVETALLQVNYGLMEDVQLSAKWPMVILDGAVDGNGDTTIAALWAPVKEDGNMPSMGLELSGRTPTGLGYTGYDGTITGVVTKTFGEVRAHLNAAYTTIGNNDADKAHTDSFAIGADYMVLDNVCLVVDGTSTMIPYDGADRVQMVEVGARTSLTDIDTLSVGVGFGLGNGNATPDFTATVGYQRAM